MNKFYIVSDATCDLPKQLYAQDFSVLQMTYFIDGTEYFCSEESLPYKRFYDLMREGATPTTSMINPHDLTQSLSPILEDGFDLLYVCFSSALSGLFQSANLAKAELSELYPNRKIVVIDSKCASGGEGLLVWYALKKRAEGATLEETADYIEGLKRHLHHDFTVDNLFHLSRGGRLSKGAAIVGTALQLKPILHVDDEGCLIPVANVMGRKKSIKTMTDTMEQQMADFKQDMVLICHGDCLDDANFLADLVRERFGLKNVVVGELGPIVGSHCGPSMLSLFYLANSK